FSGDITTTTILALYTLTLHDALPIFIFTFNPCPVYPVEIGVVKVLFYARPGLIKHLFEFLCQIAGKLKADIHSVQLIGVDIVLVDRKSTRLNSSHVKISYAVFCLQTK